MKRLVIFSCFLLLTAPTFSQWEEQDIKFLLLKKFVTQIEWPSNFNKKEFKLGVYGGMELYKQISQLDIRPYHAGTNTVSYYFLSSIENLLPCNIIYIPYDYTDEIPIIKSALEGEPILIISERSDALSKGSMINFIQAEDGNVAYEINEEALENSGLFFSYKILEGSTIISK